MINTNEIKKFARAARQRIMQLVAEKLDYVLNADSGELRVQEKQINRLRNEVRKLSAEVVIEKAAYTWFNRFVALRFMDANGYNSPMSISPNEAGIYPEIFEEAKAGRIDEELSIDRDRFYAILDSRIQTQNPENAAFKMLLLAECNRLHKMLPKVFEAIEDYTELLLPEDLIAPGSILDDVRSGMSKEDCENEEIIGWLYQFYISEKKDEVFADLAKNIKIAPENIPAATQLFTPKWIVKYMVENSLGKLWLESHPNSGLAGEMEYLVGEEVDGRWSVVDGGEEVDGRWQMVDGGEEVGSGWSVVDSKEVDGEDRPLSTINHQPSASNYQPTASNQQLSTTHHPLTTTNHQPSASNQLPTEIRFLDPCSGSGHILVYAFDVFTKIYEEAGYNRSEIPKLILENNLYGMDIDDRAVQLTHLALTMRARRYYPRYLRNAVEPQVISLQNYDIESMMDSMPISVANLSAVAADFAQAKNIGSLIRISDAEAEAIAGIDDDKSIFAETIAEIKTQAKFLSQKYHCVVTNPPYMGGKGMNPEMKKFVEKNYKDSKADLMTCFMERCLDMCIPSGYTAMINMPSWMFLSSFEDLRKKLIDKSYIQSLLHFGRGIFGIDFGSVAFTLKKEHSNGRKGQYYRLHKRNFQHIYFHHIEQLFLNAKNDESYKYDFDTYRDDDGVSEIPKESFENGLKIYYKNASQSSFAKIPGSPIAYWASEKVVQIFEKGKIGDYFESGGRTKTHNNEKYIRYSWEVSRNDLLNNKWKFIENGGDTLKWYGGNINIVDWTNNAQLFYKDKGGLSDRKYENLDGITWSMISSKSNAFRYKNNYCEYSSGSPTLFVESENIDLYDCLGYLNSKITVNLIKMINPTFNTSVGDILKLGLNLSMLNANIIREYVKNSISLSRKDWDSRETSWDFKHLRITNKELRKIGKLSEIFELWRQEAARDFFALHHNEEELNRIFIDIYGLQEELTPEVELKDVTILQQELRRDKLSELNPRIRHITNADTALSDADRQQIIAENAALLTADYFDAAELVKQLISYAVGCMMGRYSLDIDGLVIANQGQRVEYVDGGWSVVGGEEVEEVGSGWSVVGGEEVDGRWQMVDGGEEVDGEDRPLTTSNYQPTTTNQQLSTNNHQPTTTNHQLSTNTHQPTTNIMENRHEHSKFQRSSDLAASNGINQAGLYPNANDAKGRDVRIDEPNQACSSEYSEQHSGGAFQRTERVLAFSKNSNGFIGGVRDSVVFDDKFRDAGESKSFAGDRWIGNLSEANSQSDEQDKCEFVEEVDGGEEVEEVGSRWSVVDSKEVDGKNRPLSTNNHQPPTTNHQPPTIHQQPSAVFLPDSDGIIPVLEDELFGDDIVGRFREFIAVAYGEENYAENIAFIEAVLEKDIRKYFIKDFYNDHIKRYKKRPIYWLFSSPKRNFNALIYMHRYTPDMVAMLLDNYMREYRSKLDSKRMHHHGITLNPSVSAAEVNKSRKEMERIDLILSELKQYEVTLQDAALKRTEIDLDDGVRVNYSKFKDLLLPIKGMDKEE